MRRFASKVVIIDNMPVKIHTDSHKTINDMRDTIDQTAVFNEEANSDR